MPKLILLLLILVGCTASPTLSTHPSGLLDYSPVLETHTAGVKRPITSADLLSLRDIGYYFEGLTVSPDRKRVAYLLRSASVSENTYYTGWYVIELDGNSSPVYVGDGGQTILLDELTGTASGAFEFLESKWSPDSKWIAYRKKGLDGAIQVWRARANGGEEEQLTHNAADVINFRWSEDGRKILFETMEFTRAEYDRQLKEEGEQGYLYDERFRAIMSRKPVLKHSLLSWFADEAIRSSYFEYDLITGIEAQDDSNGSRLVETPHKTLTQKLEEGTTRDLRQVVQSGHQFTWLENRNPDKNKGPVPPLTVGRIESKLPDGEVLCAHSDCQGYITHVWLDDISGDIVFRRREGANFNSVTLYAWQSDDVVRPVLKTDDWFEDCSIAGGELICLYETWTAPRTIASINLGSGSVKTLVDPNPEFRNIQLSEVEALEWKGDDGAAANGHLVFPINYTPGTRYPLVVVQYRSRGFLRGGVGDEYPIHVLAANGFAVLSFDRPNNWKLAATESSVWERERKGMGEDLWDRETPLAALEGMIDSLDERGIIDPSKVGITGLSDGAETLWYAMMYSDYFAAATASSGGWTPTMYYLITSDFRKQYIGSAHGLEPPGKGTDDRWKRLSPEFHADSIKAPILIQAADREFATAIASHESLRDADRAVELYLFPDEYHIKWQPKHRSAVYERSVDWMNFWLRNVEDPDPAKIVQYERWRELRAKQ